MPYSGAFDARICGEMPGGLGRLAGPGVVKRVSAFGGEPCGGSVRWPAAAGTGAARPRCPTSPSTPR